MSFDVRFELLDVDTVTKLLDELEENTTEPRLNNWLDDRVKPFIRRRISNRFQIEGDDASGRWAPLRETTARIRARLGYGAQRPINIRTGSLYAHVMSNRTHLATLTFPDTSATSGKLREKLATAQKGGKGKQSKNMIGPTAPAPPRPVLALSSVDERFIIESLLDHLRLTP